MGLLSRDDDVSYTRERQKSTTDLAKLLIIKTGSTFPDTISTLGYFEQLFAQGLGLGTESLWIHEAYGPTPLPDPQRFCGVAITGAHSMVTDGERWIEPLQSWLCQAAAMDKPILGVCYGHQLMGQAFGGISGHHPGGPEVGTVDITCTTTADDDLLFNNLPKNFAVHVTHHQTILRLPDNAVILAANQHDPHQAVRFGDKIWGVQFHPEFTADVTRDYLNQQLELLTEYDQDSTYLLEQVSDTPESNALLRRFAELCGLA
jgi:GMP synthase (glutamine-hydrolysing)